MQKIYVDNAATTKMKKSAVAAMLPFLEENYGNPSSLYSIGQTAKAAVETARADIANCINASPSEIFFTSGGSESDNQAILTGVEIGLANGKKHIISQKTEHHAILNTLKKYEKQGFEITLLDVDSEGKITPEQVKNAIRDDTALVTIMTANNEIGTIMPVKEIAKVCREKGVLFHTDAVQAVGHIRIDVRESDCDMMSFSAHKFGGVKGVGALYVRQGVTPACLISGGGQEKGFRAGTENVAGIVAMAAALKESVFNMSFKFRKVSVMCNNLIAGISEIPMSYLNGPTKNRLPSNVNFSFEGIEGESLLLLLDSMGICASAGSACTSGSLEPSHVLTAIGRPDDLARGSLRLTLSEDNTPDEVEFIINAVKEQVKKLRGFSPVWNYLNP